MANSMQASDLMGNMLQQRPVMEYYNYPQPHNSAPIYNERNVKGASAMNITGREESTPPYQQQF